MDVERGSLGGAVLEETGSIGMENVVNNVTLIQVHALS